MGFLMTEPNSISCTQLAETYNISHDSVNRFLEREDYTPHDLYQESIQHIDNNKLIVSIDDTVLDKPEDDFGKDFIGMVGSKVTSHMDQPIDLHVVIRTLIKQLFNLLFILFHQTYKFIYFNIIIYLLLLYLDIMLTMLHISL
jgi:hypothetical protein